jgi:3-oxoacyl-(acyl-carrier-protein) synthase
VGGYVDADAFGRAFDASGFALDAADVGALDPLVHWLLHAGRAASLNVVVQDPRRAGAVIGNLSFPSAAMGRYAERVWLGEGLARAAGISRVDPRARFMSGLPAALLVKALGWGGEGFALDAACASSLYAIKLACDRLHDRSADVMLAGAVNCADDLFIHVGFCALKAMSRTGQSRPFHAQADGLVPAEGAALVALKRLDDALKDGDRVLGVIRGVGLSNDGRGRGLLVPTREGQARAMRQAYAMAGLDPRAVSLVECHATGTVVGDQTEIESMGEVFAGCAEVPIGSLKSNLGHLITAAGAGGLIKVLGAMQARQRPPTLHADALNPALENSPFRVLRELEPWDVPGPRVATVSAFGFGGNNAHLIVEALDAGAAGGASWMPAPKVAKVAREPVAIVGMGARVGASVGVEGLEAGLWGPARSQPQAREVAVSMEGLRFPPRDLELALPQQLMVLAAAQEALRSVASSPASVVGERSAALVGMGTDPTIARYGARWRFLGWASRWEAPEAWAEQARGGFAPSLEAAGVLGTMPNIPANRLNSALDLGGPSMSVSAEELSGVRALEVGVRAVATGEVDAALVGAVDLSREAVHEQALRELRGREVRAGDAAVVLVLKRLEDARRDGDSVWAILDMDGEGEGCEPWGASGEVEARFGAAHAASGLVQVAAATLALVRQRAVGGGSWKVKGVRVELDGMEGQRASVVLRQGAGEVKVGGAEPVGGRTLRLAAHWEPPALELPSQESGAVKPWKPAPGDRGLMEAAPALEPVLPSEFRAAPVAAVPVVVAPVAAVPVAAAPAAVAVREEQPVWLQPAAPDPLGSARTEVLERWRDLQTQMGAAHRRFIEGQGQTQEMFLGLAQRNQARLLEAYAAHRATTSAGAPALIAAPAPASVPTPAVVAAPVSVAAPIKNLGGLGDAVPQSNPTHQPFRCTRPACRLRGSWRWWA